MASKPSSEPGALTFPYKRVGDEAVYLDLYPPYLTGLIHGVGNVPVVPVVIYFHGGGLTVGNRRSWFPRWLKSRVEQAGYAFIAADYRLIPPSTGHDILADIIDLFAFVAHDLNYLIEQNSVGAKFQVNADAIAVAGTSAGGLCCYLSAVHASPKPKAILCMYALGGDFLTSHYITPKMQPFFLGRDLLDPASFQQFLYPLSSLCPLTSDSALAYDPPSAPIPFYPSNPRMLLTRLYLQLGILLDYYTGNHEPSLSSMLRETLVEHANHKDMVERLQPLIPESDLHLFPQFGVTKRWPPTFLVHGKDDTAVPVHESRNMRGLLEQFGVPVTLVELQGEHSLDYVDNAETLFGSTFDAAIDFLEKALGAIKTEGGGPGQE